MPTIRHILCCRSTTQGLPRRLAAACWWCGGQRQADAHPAGCHWHRCRAASPLQALPPVSPAATTWLVLRLQLIQNHLGNADRARCRCDAAPTSSPSTRKSEGNATRSNSASDSSLRAAAAEGVGRVHQGSHRSGVWGGGRRSTVFVPGNREQVVQNRAGVVTRGRGRTRGRGCQWYRMTVVIDTSTRGVGPSDRVAVDPNRIKKKKKEKEETSERHTRRPP